MFTMYIIPKVEQQNDLVLHANMVNHDIKSVMYNQKSVHPKM